MNESASSEAGVVRSKTSLDTFRRVELKPAGRSDTRTYADCEPLLRRCVEEAYISGATDNGEVLYCPSHRGSNDASTPFASSPNPPESVDHLTLYDNNSLHLENISSGRVDEGKGKGRAIITESDAGRDSDQATAIEESSEETGGLTRKEKDEQSRLDADMSLMVLAQELLEHGVPQEEIASYIYHTQHFATPPLPRSVVNSPFQSPRPPSPLEEKLDLDRIAQLTVDGVATRPLPPAYGSNYTPEPSTSVAGSPILAVRRGSISSITSNTTASSTSGSSSYTAEEEEELVAKMQKFLDECYEANKAAILSDVDAQDRETKGKFHRLRKDVWRGWHHCFGIGLSGDDGVTVASGVEGNWIEERTNQCYGLSTPSPSSIPSDMWSVHQGGHGSAALTPQGPASRRGPDQSPASYFSPGERGGRAGHAGARHQGI